MDITVVPFKHYEDFKLEAEAASLKNGTTFSEEEIKLRQEKQDKKWDKFIENNSYNGTFLQSRNFLNYHKDRFKDCSLFIYKGTSDILAVIPAVEIIDDGHKIFNAHAGSTFGGIVFNKQFYNLKHLIAFFDVLEQYWQYNGYDKVILKQSSQIFSTCENDLFEYFFFQRKYHHYSEISFIIPLEKYNSNIPSNFSGARRRDFNYSLKNGFIFRKLETDEEVTAFYNLLCENMLKFDTKPVHTLEELLDFKNSRLRDIVEFWGTYKDNKLMAGSMSFLFKLNGNKTVFHTQYLASSQKNLELFPNNFNDANLIRIAKERNYDIFSFGTSTLEHGAILNEKLAEFKEGFGTTYSNNKVWIKDFSKN